MTTNVFWRLAWKEYRQQRDLLIAIGLIAMALMIIALGWSWLENHELSTDTAYHIALMMPVFYVLGCAAMLFAGEHERDTFAFLRALPLRSREAFWPKSLVAIVSTLLLSALLVLMAALLTRFRPLKTPADFDLLLHYFLIMAEVLLWTMLFSQLLKHPFWAMAAAGLVYCASFLLIAFVGSLIQKTLAPPGGESEYSILVALRCAVTLLLAGVNVVLGTAWLERDRVLIGQSGKKLAFVPGAGARWSMLGRLWWQSLRESGWIFAAIYGVLVLLSVLVLIERGSVILIWGGLPALIGSFTFFQDHWKQHYRFFAEHGVPPRTLWWARVLGSFAVCLPWLVVMIVATATTLTSHDAQFGWFRGGSRSFNWPGDLLVLGILFFAWGQWCSLLFRAGMVGVFFGVATCVFLMFGVEILRFLTIPDWLGVYIPAAMLLWASWYRAPDWLAERKSWGRFFRYAATLAVPSLLYLASLLAHRAYEIPQVVDSSAFVSGPAGIRIPESIAKQHPAALAEMQRPATAEELETARLYRELLIGIRQLPSSGSGGAMAGSAAAGSSITLASPRQSETSGLAEADQWKKERAEKLGVLVGRFVEISQRPAADFFPHLLQLPEPDMARIDFEFEAAVREDALRLDDAKEFAQSQERYLSLLRFARHYQQRGDETQIASSLQLQARTYDHLLSRASRIEQPKESILALREVLNEAPYNFVPDYELAWLRSYTFQRGIAEFNPAVWKALRLSNGQAPFVDRSIALLSWLPWERVRMRRWFDYQVAVDQPQNPRSQALRARWAANTIGRRVRIWAPDDPALRFPRLQQAAMQLRLLLLAWKSEHGELPRSLEELERDFPQQVPLDAVTGGPWVYRPNGIPAEERLHRPFIWSPMDAAGNIAAIYPGMRSPPDRYGTAAPMSPESPGSSDTDTTWTRQGTLFQIEPGDPLPHAPTHITP